MPGVLEHPGAASRKETDTMDDTTHEEWRLVPGFEDRYWVSNQGRLYDGLAKREKGKPDKRGYIHVTLYDGKARQSKSFGIHRLVALAFLGTPPLGYVANHKNGDKSDNRLENLEFISHSDNTKHSYDTGLNWAVGSNHSNAHLCECDVRAIRTRYSNGERVAKLAREFGVSYHCIRAIVFRKTWAWLKD